MKIGYILSMSVSEFHINERMKMKSLPINAKFYVHFGIYKSSYLDNKQSPKSLTKYIIKSKVQ